MLSYISLRGCNVQMTMGCICCGAILTLFQFERFLCFLCFLFSTHYHTLPYTKEKGNIDIAPFIKLYQMYVILYKSAYKLKLWTTLI